MLKTRLIVNTYTYTTLPIYYAIQKPWRTLLSAQQMRSKKFKSINGELVWARDDTPIYHPFLQCQTYAEVLRDLKDKDKHDPNRLTLGQRDIIDHKLQTDETGIQTNYQLLLKFELKANFIIQVFLFKHKLIFCFFQSNFFF
jgi:hypothetical protein